VNGVVSFACKGWEGATLSPAFSFEDWSQLFESGLFDGVADDVVAKLDLSPEMSDTRICATSFDFLSACTHPPLVRLSKCGGEVLRRGVPEPWRRHASSVGNKGSSTRPRQRQG
jgi:hypothetical protein